MSVALLGAALMVLAYSSAPQAFHSGGVAECGGCHSMHSPKPGGSFLLVGTDASSACLTCHQNANDTGPSSYHVSTAPGSLGAGQAPLQRTPGGDFGWLKKTYSFTVRGNTITEHGDTHGHNVVAEDFGYVPDGTNTTAPGGVTSAYPSSRLGCQSCHDPHGRARRLSDGSYVNAIYTPGSTNAPIIASGSYNNSPAPVAGQAVGVYRLLRGLNDNEEAVTFAGVAVAIAPSSYNRSEASTTTRVAYGSSGANTWGNWCGTCHEGMHSRGDNYVHPVDDSLGNGVVSNYNAYVKSGDLTGSAATSYSSLVPFMEKTGDIGVLQSHAQNNNSYMNGPGNSDEVSCLSCHRAHASGWEYALRWNMEGEFMTYNGLWPGTDNGAPVQFARGRTAAETQAAYYDRPATQFASYQRVLCNKCHAKD